MGKTATESAAALLNANVAQTQSQDSRADHTPPGCPTPSDAPRGKYLSSSWAKGVVACRCCCSSRPDQMGVEITAVRCENKHTFTPQLQTSFL